jgi:hypothetical protein
MTRYQQAVTPIEAPRYDLRSSEGRFCRWLSPGTSGFRVIRNASMAVAAMALWGACAFPAAMISHWQRSVISFAGVALVVFAFGIVQTRGARTARPG